MEKDLEKNLVNRDMKKDKVDSGSIWVDTVNTRVTAFPFVVVAILSLLSYIYRDDIISVYNKSSEWVHWFLLTYVAK